MDTERGVPGRGRAALKLKQASVVADVPPEEPHGLVQFILKFILVQNWTEELTCLVPTDP